MYKITTQFLIFIFTSPKTCLVYYYFEDDIFKTLSSSKISLQKNEKIEDMEDNFLLFLFVWIYYDVCADNIYNDDVFSKNVFKILRVQFIIL